jgi:phosphate transport system permease protein
MFSSFKARKLKNHLFTLILVICSIIVLTPLFLIFKYVFVMGASSLNWDFFTQLPVPVGDVGGGMKHAILGTLTMVTIAGIVAVPFGLLCGIFLAEYPKGHIPNLLRFAIDLLTGVPSIVIGIFAYILVVVPLKSFSALAGAFALSIIILPIITRSTEEILKLVPEHVREAGLALGLPRWKMIYYIVVKGNFKSLITGIMLAFSRAAGETAPLLFTAFGSRFISYQLSGPMASLPVQIYTYAISPFEDWQRQAWGGAFVLIVLVLGTNLLARSLVNWRKIRYAFTKDKVS